MKLGGLQRISRGFLDCSEVGKRSKVDDNEKAPTLPPGLVLATALRNRGLRHQGWTVFRLFLLLGHGQLQDRGALAH